MVMTDPVADMFTRIRNAVLAGQDGVVVPYSAFKEKVALLLKKEGYASEVRKFKEKGAVHRFLSLNGLKITHIKRLSKPGRRWYASWKEIQAPPMGVRMVSTSQGIMTHKEARRRKLGGELIGEVW
ncbi:MAG: 30S ribosomal protein S8 [Patescibacteria group bacterium]|nr:MAG: 30S ribosomal protein S8 [Patescibacteria group bacterium]